MIKCSRNLSLQGAAATRQSRESFIDSPPLKCYQVQNDIKLVISHIKVPSF